MRIEAIAIGENAPEDINVIIEVPVGGEPINAIVDERHDPGFIVVGTIEPHLHGTTVGDDNNRRQHEV